MWCGDPCVDKQFLLDPHPILTVGITLSLGFIVLCLKYKHKKNVWWKQYVVTLRQRRNKAPSYIGTKRTAILNICAKRVCFGFCFRRETLYKVEILNAVSYKSNENTNLMQHCAGFVSAGSLYMFRAQAPIIRSI